MKKIAIAIVNLLTLARIVLLYVLIREIISGKEDYACQTAIWACMGLTDLFDGLLARMWGAATRFGAKFDIIADKIITVMIPPVLWQYRAFPTWAAVLLILLVVFWLWQAWLYRKATGDVPTSRKWGKWAVAMWGIGTIPFVAGFPDIGEIALIVPATLSVFAIYDYAKVYGWRWH